MTQNQIRKAVAFFVRSSGKRIYMTPEHWNILLPLVDYDILKNKYGYPKSNIGVETDQQITDSLIPFKSEPTTVSLTAGEGDLPSDYLHLMRVKISGAKYVDVVTELEHKERDENSIIAASARYPIVTLYKSSSITKIKVEPTTITSADVVYIKRPTTPVFAYNITNGVITDSGSSVDFEWRAEHDIDIIRILLEYLNIPSTPEQVQNYLQYKKQEEN